MTVKRPIVRYHGGKWLLSPWILSHLPAHKVYTESYGGGGSLLLRKPRSYAEIYNDLDSEIVNLFRVARDDGERLQAAVELTPFSREEFVASYEPSPEPLEQARRTLIRSFMGYGSSSVSKLRAGNSESAKPATGFRANSNRSGTTPAHDWKSWPNALPSIIDRLRGVVIENRPATEVMAAHDGSETLHYVDPPYVLSTRTDEQNDYRFEMSDSDHCELSDFLKTLKGMVVLSGYTSPLYDELYRGWRRVDRAALADGAKKRTESLWFSPNCPSNQLF